MMTFSEALEQVGNGIAPSVLLGNGFSRAYDNDIFNYASLFQEADFAERDVEVRALFTRLGTHDFEAVMRALSAARTVLESYGNHAELVARIDADEVVLKDALITVISNTHPSRPRDVTEAQYRAVRLFLDKFQHVFTVNYDLLFYWARNMNDYPPMAKESDDGFRWPNTWTPARSNKQVHFLHGGLHLFEDKKETKKHAYKNNEKNSIIDQVRMNLDKGKFPLFVAEPTSTKKKARIELNSYLSSCLDALTSIEGAFFILGHSMDENDKHIFSKLKTSKVTQFFISVYGDEQTEDNQRTIANARAYLGKVGRSIEFFDAATAPVWQ